MTKLPAMFWSGETLSERLKTLIDPFVSGRVDCAAYTLSIGPEVYVSPNDQTAEPTTVTIRKLNEKEAFTIPPRPVRLPAHRGGCLRPSGCAGLHLHSSEDQVPWFGQRIRVSC